MGIDEAEALPIQHILPEHGFKEGGFARARLADDESVEEAVRKKYSEWTAVVAGGADARAIEKWPDIASHFPQFAMRGLDYLK